MSATFLTNTYGESNSTNARSGEGSDLIGLLQGSFHLSNDPWYPALRFVMTTTACTEKVHVVVLGAVGAVRPA